MKRPMSAGLFALVFVLPALSAPAEETTDPLANAPTQYSADLVVTRKVGLPKPMTMKVYVDGNKRRTEQEANAGNIVILRGDLSKRYILSPSSRTYTEGPLDTRMLESPTEWAKRMGIVHEKVGTEDINGEACDKYRYTSDSKKMPNGQTKPTMPAMRPVTGFIWVGQTTHMLVKSENAGSTAEWKNIKLGPPDASLFEVPPDYKKSETSGPALLRPEVPKSQDEKSEEQKPVEVKSGDQSPSPTPSASAATEKSDEQKSDGDK